MKSIFLMILLSTMLFSYEKQIILGNYNNDINVKDAVKKIESLSKSDSKLEKLLKKNSIKVVSKNIGKYKVVSLVSFNSYTQLLRTLDVLNKYYDGLYVLDYSLKQQNIRKVSLPKASLPIKAKKTVSNKPVSKEENFDMYLIILLAILSIAYIVYKRNSNKTQET